MDGSKKPTERGRGILNQPKWALLLEMAALLGVIITILQFFGIGPCELGFCIEKSIECTSDMTPEEYDKCVLQQSD